MDRLTVGAATLYRVEETVDTSFTGRGFFHAFDPEVLRPHLDWLVPRYYIAERDALVFSMHSWVVKTGRHTVIIDTCIGNDKDRLPREHWHRLRTPFLDRLRASGTAPEDVDYVMCTHMHADHVGRNSRLRDGRWEPTFPNARYLFSRIEYEHWMAHPDPNPIRRNAIQDSVLPIVETGRANNCNRTGYKGRMGIYEIMVMNNEIRRLIIGQSNTNIIRTAAKKNGMNTLRNSGLIAAYHGLTTIHEVARETILS